MEAACSGKRSGMLPGGCTGVAVASGGGDDGRGQTMRRRGPRGGRRRPASTASQIPTFAAFAAAYIRSRAHDIPASISRVRDTVAAATRIFGDVRMDRIEPLHIEEFRTQRLEAVAPGTVRRDLAVLHAVFHSAVRHRL